MLKEAETHLNQLMGAAATEAVGIQQHLNTSTLIDYLFISEALDHESTRRSLKGLPAVWDELMPPRWQATSTKFTLKFTVMQRRSIGFQAGIEMLNLGYSIRTGQQAMTQQKVTFSVESTPLINPPNKEK